jgi:hypothetical protein
MSILSLPIEVDRVVFAIDDAGNNNRLEAATVRNTIARR